VANQGLTGGKPLANTAGATNRQRNKQLRVIMPITYR
jgi:hypothetical protein